MKDTLFQWVPAEWVTALGWTFLHSLWQIALIGMLMYGVLRRIPGHKASMRYTLSTLFLWLVVVSALSTFILMLPERAVVTNLTGPVFVQEEGVASSGPAAWRLWLESRMPVLLVLWLLGAAFLLLRLAVSLGWLWHIRRTSIPVDFLQQRLDHLVDRLGLQVRPIAGGSGWMPSPVTIGHVKPVILFPLAVINRLSTEEVEAILAHELAHIVRHDYLANLVQSFIESVFYYHPVVWWMSRVVRAERENRADDLAIRWYGDAMGYARTLVAVQEWQQEAVPGMALGFASRRGQTLRRIQRILNLPYQHHHQMEKSVLLSLASVLVIAMMLQAHAPAPNSGQPANRADFAPFHRVVYPMTTDTIPSEGTYRIHKKTDDQEIQIELEDGDIRKLEVDGRKIDPGEYDAFRPMIDELISGLAAPPAPFIFHMPAIPPMPDMPQLAPIPPIPALPDFPDGFEFSFEMPDIPDMPDMPEFRWHGFGSEDGPAIFHWDGDGGHVRILSDSSADGQSRMTIIVGDDTMQIAAHSIFFQDDRMPFGEDGFHWDSKAWQEEMKAWQKEAEARSRAWGDEYRRHADEMGREHGQEIRRHAEEMQRKAEQEARRQYDRQRADQDRIREELRIRVPGPMPFGHASPQSVLTEQLVRDGLVDPGDPVDVLLTPDKLRIDGKRMPDNLHEKYLRLYEAQTGDELAGNSRVEFTTKARQRF